MPRKYRAPVVFLIAIASLILVPNLGLTCNGTGICTPFTPGYNWNNGTCTSGSTLGPAYPGTGNLPTEPGTQAPTSQPVPGSDPGAVDLATYGLNGRWTDNGHSVCINQAGNGVTATYYDNYECDPQDGNPVDTTHADFSAELSGTGLLGDTTICSYGHDDPSQNGIKTATLIATVSDDGKTITGNWYYSQESSSGPVTLTRDTVGDCHATP